MSTWPFALGCLSAIALGSSPVAAQAVLHIAQEDVLAIGASVRSQVGKCWKPPSADFGVPPRVRVTFALKRDGSLDGPPQLIAEGARGVTADQAAAAIKAVETCAPYSLPARYFDHWRRVTINFAHSFLPSASPSPQ